MPCISQTLVGFVYPLSVSFFPIPQVLFHTWNAHGVSLSEPFAVLKAVTLPSPLLLCGSFAGSVRITNNSMKTGNWRFGVLFLEQSSTLYESCYVSNKASCSLRVFTFKASVQAMKPASWSLLFCSYFDTWTFAHYQKSALEFCLHGCCIISFDFMLPFWCFSPPDFQEI